MSGFDLTGGLAALRSRVLPQQDVNHHQQQQQQQQQRPSSPPNHNHFSRSHQGFGGGGGGGESGPPQLPRLQTDFSSNDFFSSGSSEEEVRSEQRGSAESSSTFSGRSGPSTALTTPNASLEQQHQHQQQKAFGAGSGWPPPAGPSPDRRDSSLSAVSASNTASVRGSSAVFAYSDHLLSTTSPLLNGGGSGSGGSTFSAPSRSGSRSTSAGSAAGGSRVNSGHLSPNMVVPPTPNDVGDDSFATESSRSASAQAASEANEKAKKANPLQDLIQTEKAYVAELSMIIRRVASAWNRSNFPPAELDIMFRNIESIYRVDKAFLKSLKEIGPEPTSPRALGDLLMRWIDDLEAPYARYCENYFTDFDTWPAVQSNGRLLELLTEISDPATSEATTKGFSDKKRQLGDRWTLDGLFALPQLRLKYFKKLYARLLKSTNPGRSDHRLLVSANEKLDELLEKATRRISMSVLDDSPMAQREREEAINNQNLSANGRASSEARSSPLPPPSPLSPVSPTENISSANLLARIGDLDFGGRVGSPGGDTTPSAAAPRELSPKKATTPPPPLIPPFTAQQPLSADDIVTQSNHQELPSADELERSLDMSRVLDLFTMKPKKCQLRINPETLPFKRGMRKSADVVIDFKPMSTREELTWRRGHIFLLTDLFLICDRMTPSERAERGMGSDGMWLLFPPLAGKHVQVAERPGSGHSLAITILKKETLTIHLDSREEKEAWMRAFADCNDFATQMGLKLKNIPKPPASANSSRSDGSGSGSGSGSVSGAPFASANSMMSPTISVTPSESLPRMPSSSQDRAPSSLARDGSVTSTGSFPQIRSSSRGPSDPMSPGFGPRSSPSNASFHSSTSPPTGPVRPGPNSPGFRPMGASPGARPMRPPYHNGPGPGPGMMNGRPSPQQQQFPRPPPGQRPPPPGQSYGRPPPPRPDSGFGRPQSPGGPGGPGSNGGSGGGHLPSRPDFINRPPPQQGRPPPEMLRDSSRRPSAPNLRDRANGAMTPPVRTRSASSVGSNGTGGPAKLPSAMMKDGDLRHGPQYSPPSSPQLKAQGPTTSTVSAQMRCRLYLKQSHAQWKSLGNARLKLYHILPVDHKQLVVENDRKTLISTIVLSDGVERVGKVGVAVEVSDQGNRTGIVYMLQMRSEESAQGLFGELIDGSGRTVAVG